MEERVLYRNEEIWFDPQIINTQEFRRTSQFFDKHGVYTKAHPRWDKREYDEFWDEEERRCLNGYTVGNIAITGEHYDYLNYGRIRLTRESENRSEKRRFDETNGEPVIKDRRAATKIEAFPDFWDGDYHYFKAKQQARDLGLHLCVGKSRRKGYSFKNGKCASRRVNFFPGSTTLIVAYDTAYLYPEGTMQMTDQYLQWYNEHTDWFKRRLVDRSEFIKLGYIDNSMPDVERGYRSLVMALSAGPNKPGCARGKDAQEVYAEEAGKFPNLIGFIDATLDTMRDGIYTTGQMIVFGTGGGSAVNWEGFEEVFYEPETRDFMTIDNIWDEGVQGTSCGFFHPDYWNIPGFMDANGNSDVESAITNENKIRENIKKHTNNPNAVTARAMEHPNYPREAFARSGTNIFPTQEILHHLHTVERDPDIRFLHRTGMCINTSDGIKFKHDPNLTPVMDFPLRKGMPTDGCVVMWQPPYKDPATGKIPDGLYSAWHDPYATDKDKEKINLRDSMGVTYIYENINTFTPSSGDIIVASYIGRPPRLVDYNDQLINFLEYYRAKMLFESDRGDVIPHFRYKKKLHLLESEPDIVWKKELQGKTGRNWGLHINTGRKENGAIYHRDWLITPRGEDADTGREKWNLHYIYDIGWLKELLKWNLKGNFDRVSAGIVGMYNMKESLQSRIIKKPVNEVSSIFNRPLFTN